MTVPVEDLALRQAVEDTVIRMFVATDERNWPALEACFTNPFKLDMTSMVGGSPVTMTPRQVAEAWAEGFRPLDHVHHQVGNLQTTVSAQRAQVRCYGVAFHHRSKVTSGAKTRIFVGTYELQLEARAAGGKSAN
jgi:hypothetical protein